MPQRVLLDQRRRRGHAVAAALGRAVAPWLLVTLAVGCAADVQSVGPAAAADSWAASGDATWDLGGPDADPAAKDPPASVPDAGHGPTDAPDAGAGDAAAEVDASAADSGPSKDADANDTSAVPDSSAGPDGGGQDAAASDPCAAASDGAWCLLGLQPGSSEFAAPYTIVVCESAKTLGKSLCSLGCVQAEPGKATCATAQATCGNAACEAGESCSTCPKDCGSCFPGDDCAKKADGNWCGSGFTPAVGKAGTLFTCKGGVTQATTDCTQGCQVGTSGQDQCKGVAVACGNGQCEGSETCGTCASDCGTCPPICGDGTCGSSETCGTCAQDCGACPPVCGDGTCDPPETCSTCAKDCACADPCAGAASGDGAYCTASLKPPSGPPDTLYQCKAKKTVSSQACAYGCHVAPPGVPDTCNAKPPDPGSTPKGKGVWVWLFNTTAGSPSAVAQEAQDLGIGFVLIKSGEDTATYDSNFNAQVVSEFTSRGMEVYGWPYVTPGNIDAKAAAVVKSAKIPGVKGIILDVEGEFVGHDAEALDLCAKIRAQVPGVFLGYTTYGWVMYHLNFPYKAFDQGCGDAFLPQSYWDKWSTGPTGGYQKALDGVSYLKLKAPVWPVQDNYGPDDKSSTTTSGLNEFFGVAGPRASLWRWPNPGNKVLHDQLKLLNWKN